MNAAGAVRRMSACVAAMVMCASLTACSSRTPSSDASPTSISRGTPSTVEVRKGGVTPLASSSTSVRVSSVFPLTAPAQGWFHSTVVQGAYAHAGDVLGSVGGRQVTAPVDGVVETVAQDNDVAAGYPLFSMRYGSMSADVDATALLTTIGPDQRLAGRFQIADAQGPTDCAAVVDDGVIAPSSSAEGTGGSDGSAEPAQGAGPTRTLQCLFPKNVRARPGQNATVVLTAAMIEDALILPVTAVAGRLGSGQVSKRDGGSFTTVNVKLGASDGTSIIILDGLKEGDTVSSTAPNLVPGAQS